MIVSWRRFCRDAEDEFPTALNFERGAREALQGKCSFAAKALASLIGGRAVKGVYHGLITARRELLLMSMNRDRSMQHWWVEKDGMIYDPTWWAFTDSKLGIYEFPTDDTRYRRTSQ